MNKLIEYQKLKAKWPRTPVENALLLIAEDNWEAAHEMAQSREGEADFDRLHALLHRIEADDWNARYWYRRVGLPYPTISIEEEWRALANYSLL